MTDEIQRGSQRITDEQWAAFLTCLRKTANVSASARGAGFDPKTAYRRKDVDAEFAEQWAGALKEACDELRSEAWHAALEGDEEYVVSMGKLVLGPDGQHLKVRKKDRNVLVTLMRAHDPLYRPQQAVPYVPPPVESDDLVAARMFRIMKAMEATVGGTVDATVVSTTPA